MSVSSCLRETAAGVSRREVKIFLSFVLVASLFPNWLPMYSNSQMDLTRAMVEDGTVDISAYANNTGDKVHYRNHTYSDKAPGASFLAVPIYAPFALLEGAGMGSPPDRQPVAVADVYTFTPMHPALLYPDTPPVEILLRYLSILLLSIVPTGIVLVLIHRLLREEGFSRRVSTATALIFGFATILLFHSTVFLGDALAMAFGFSAFHLLMKEDSSRNRTVLAGFLGGMAVTTEYYAAIVPALLGGYLLARERDRVTAFAAGGVLGVLPLLVYNLVTTGNPFIPVIAYQQLYGASVQSQTLSLCSSCLPTFLGWTPTPQFLLPNLLRLLFYPSRGLFFYSPVLLLAVPGIVLLYRRNRDMAVLIGGIVGMFLAFNAGWLFWFGGPSLGPRYLVPMLPFLALPFAEGLRRATARKRWMALVVVLLIPSIYIAFLGFNGVQITPTATYENAITTATDSTTEWTPRQKQRYTDTVFSTALLLNPLPRQHTLFLEHGPTSPWIELVSGIPDSGLDTGSRADADVIVLGQYSGEVVTVRSSFLPLFLAAAILLLVWREDLYDLSGLPVGRRAAVTVAVLVLLVFPFLNLAPVAWGDGWWAPHEDGGETYRFMGSEGEVLLAAEERTSGFLQVGYSTFYPQKSLQQELDVRVNGREERVRLMADGTFYVPVTLDRGVNTVRLSAVDGCTRPAGMAERNTRDKRCISLRVDTVRFTDRIGGNGTVVFGRNWMAQDGETALMTENATAYVNATTPHETLIGAMFSRNRSRNVTVHVDGVRQEEIGVMAGNITPVNINLSEGVNRIVFDPQPGCTGVAIEREGTVELCITAGLIDPRILRQPSDHRLNVSQAGSTAGPGR
ncbi:MAG: hypothetical protein SVW77_00590 [Candidatus Nanohaloarchaea archaeon]|nr:hypothetical protein [Candidatus Nanohaloarchaea archaeon]